MAVEIRLRCDECGRASEAVMFDGSAPHKQIMKLQKLDGWSRQRPAVTSAMQDLCPACSKARIMLRDRKAVSK